MAFGNGKRLAKDCTMRVEDNLGTTMIRLYGEFDLSCEQAFEAELADAVDPQTGTLIVDLRELKFIDSTGLRILVELHRDTTQNAVDFTVLCGDGQVGKVLHQAGLHAVLPIVDPAGVVPDA